MIILSIVSLAAFFAGVYFVINGELVWIISIVLGGLFCILLGFFIKGQIHDIVNPEKRILSQQENYEASKERLKDMNYLTILANTDPLAKRLLSERINGKTEHYAKKPEIISSSKAFSTKKQEKTIPCARAEKENKAEIKSQEELLNSIEKMKKMHDAGILTQEEFETKKAELLTRL